jgi:hypothetical protein
MTRKVDLLVQKNFRKTEAICVSREIQRSRTLGPKRMPSF